MAGAAELLANPIVALLLRVALGAYIVYMARGFYADPLAYFRRWMPRLPEYAWMRQGIRAAACFCVWGGCFIVVAAIATQLLGLHGLWLAFALMLMAAIAAYWLLPKAAGPMAESESRELE